MQDTAQTSVDVEKIKKGIHLYELAIEKYLGDVLFRFLKDKSIKTWEEICSVLETDCQKGEGAWVDLSGLLTPKSQVDALLSGIISGSVNTIEEIDAALKKMFDNYAEYEFLWAIDKLKTHFGVDKHISKGKFLDFVDKWKNASIALNTMMQDDLKKEFGNYMTVGFGLDNPEEKENDVIAVRGQWDDNGISKLIFELIEEANQTALFWKKMFFKE